MLFFKGTLAMGVLPLFLFTETPKPASVTFNLFTTMAAASIAIDLYSTIKQKIKEYSTDTRPKIAMSENTFNELTDTLQHLEYNGAGHYLREFMQVEGCKVIISSTIEDGTFELLE